VEKNSRGKARQQEAHHRCALRDVDEKRVKTRLQRRIQGISRRYSAHERHRQPTDGDASSPTAALTPHA
jgi:hypothetical protein